MTTFLLVRHASHPLIGRVLVGRNDAIALSPQGREQARRLAEVLAHEPVASVQSSPQRRAVETAEFIAARHVLPVETSPALDELDFGEWTGHSFDALQGDLNWQKWNRTRASITPLGGESMLKLQDRVLRHLTELRHRYRDGTVVLVSHADPIRAALLHERRMSLNEFSRIDVAPASVHVLHQGRKVAHRRIETFAP